MFQDNRVVIDIDNSRVRSYEMRDGVDLTKSRQPGSYVDDLTYLRPCAAD